MAKAVSISLNACMSCLPGQRDIDIALKSINTSQEVLSAGSFPRSDGRSYAELQVRDCLMLLICNFTLGHLLLC